MSEEFYDYVIVDPDLVLDRSPLAASNNPAYVAEDWETAQR